MGENKSAALHKRQRHWPLRAPPKPATLGQLMHMFGLTGGLGSGKSTVAEYWHSQLLDVVDADALAHEAVALETPAPKRIVAARLPTARVSTEHEQRYQP